MAKSANINYTIGSQTGFHTPIGHATAEGDAYDAPPAMTPIGPVPDPIGNISGIGAGKRGPQDLPTR